MAENQNQQAPENCTHDCSSCGENCPSRKLDKTAFAAPANEHSAVKKMIGVVSGKGGVGKSLVTSLLAVAANRKGLAAGILDADITGPSIPKIFGVHRKAYGTDLGLLPVYTDNGIGMMSINLVLDDEEAPVIWRGPVIAGVVKQFWTDVAWGDVDVLLVDMPPGTGDVPLTAFQSLPIDGIIIVTSPQDLVAMVVEKAVRMAEKMDVPVLGIVENMSYLTCPDCGKKISVFGDSGVEKIAKAHDVETIIRLPILPELAALCDAGRIEDVDPALIAEFAKLLED